MKENNLNNIILKEEKNEIIIKESKEYRLNCNESKKVTFIVERDVNASIYEIEEIKNDMIYNYYLKDNSLLVINKFYDLNNINEVINIYLDGFNSSVILNLSTISNGKQNFKINVFHNNKNSISKTNIHGITFLGEINIENNGYIIKNSKNSDLIQDNKIIVINENNSSIKPNLYIDEQDVEASHGAYVGKFSEEDLFYFKTRGLTEKESYSLLSKGFLINEMNFDNVDMDKINKILNKYWR